MPRPHASPAALKSLHKPPAPPANRRDPQRDLLTPTAVCRILAVDEPGLLDLVNRLGLPAYNIGGSIRFRPNEVRAFQIRAETMQGSTHRSTQ